MSFVEKRSRSTKEILVKTTERAHLAASTAVASDMRKLRRSTAPGQSGGWVGKEVEVGLEVSKQGLGSLGMPEPGR